MSHFSTPTHCLNSKTLLTILREKHSPCLLPLMALFDRQPPLTGGAATEFLHPSEDQKQHSHSKQPLLIQGCCEETVCKLATALIRLQTVFTLEYIIQSKCLGERGEFYFRAYTNNLGSYLRNLFTKAKVSICCKSSGIHHIQSSPLCSVWMLEFHLCSVCD